MIGSYTIRLVALLAIAALVTTWGYATSWWFILIELLLMYDLIDATLRMSITARSDSATIAQHTFSARPPSVPESDTPPFAVLLSVHNLEADFDAFAKRFEPLKSITWIIDDQSTDGTFNRLRNSGWNVIANRSNTNKPGAIKRLVEHLPESIRVVVVTDPDTEFALDDTSLKKLQRICREFDASNLAAICPRLSVAARGPLGLLQEIEYQLAFRLGRASMGTLSTTSGVAIYKRNALAATLASHSLSVYAEDLENTLILLSEHQSILYVDDLTVQTECKEVVADLFSQRVGWAQGLARALQTRRNEVRAISWHSPLGFYQYRIYLYTISFLIFPARLVAMIVVAVSLLNGLEQQLRVDMIPDVAWADPGIFAGIYIKYTILAAILTIILSPADRLPRQLTALPLYVFYGIGLIVPTATGFANWACEQLFNRKIFYDHYEGARA